MTKEDVKLHIMSIVINHQGCKLLSIIPELPYAVLPWMQTEHVALTELIDELIKEKRLHRFRYSIPELGNREKMFLIPSSYDVY